MKANYLFASALVIALHACNNAPNQKNEIDDSEYASSTATVLKKSTMKGYTTDIEKDATENTNYRKVLYTGEHMQLVLMSLKPGEEIGEETHLKSDQFFRFESGIGKCIVNGKTYDVKAGDVVIVPSGSKHNVINTDPINDLKLYTIYALPNHKDGIVRATKQDAEKHEAKFDGKTTE
ncbi:MAG: cupin domain-containing protein [Cyclobacteriaceae bacterium]|jgi:mannose-6-phosphate isomerase-like protein (cupin superfamily)